MPEEAGLKYLLMQARAVKAAGHSCPYVKYECVIGGSGVYSVGVKALVENEAAEHRFAVELEAALL